MIKLTLSKSTENIDQEKKKLHILPTGNNGHMAEVSKVCGAEHLTKNSSAIDPIIINLQYFA